MWERDRQRDGFMYREYFHKEPRDAGDVIKKNFMMGHYLQHNSEGDQPWDFFGRHID